MNGALITINQEVLMYLNNIKSIKNIVLNLLNGLFLHRFEI